MRVYNKEPNDKTNQQMSLLGISSIELLRGMTLEKPKVASSCGLHEKYQSK